MTNHALWRQLTQQHLSTLSSFRLGMTLGVVPSTDGVDLFYDVPR